jgi:hypothetical protein
MDARTYATLAAAVIAAVAAVWNAAFTSVRNARLEREKLQRADRSEEQRWNRAREDEAHRWKVKRQDEFDALYRAALGTLAEAMAACGQSLSWLTWKAKQAPESLTVEDVDVYNGRMLELLPRVVSAHLLAVAHDGRVDDVAKEKVERLYALDLKASLAGARLADDRDSAIGELGDVWDQTEDYFTELHDSFRSILAPPPFPIA